MANHHDTPHYHRVVRRLARSLRHRCGVTTGATIVVGCSGGADSVALLRALALLAKRRKWQLKLIVAHAQHHLREEAEADAAFVKQLADTLALPHARRDIHPRDEPGNLEANARRLRYQALADIATQHNANFVATAHHADDQLETLIMRILRGTSVAGLRGIAHRRPLPTSDPSTNNIHAIRPLLDTAQSDLAALLDQLHQPWREDATNRDTARTRAKLRHDIIPLLKQLQPDAAHKANALTEHFRDLHHLVQTTTDQAQQTIATAPINKDDDAAACFALPRDQARLMNPAVLTQMLRRALIQAGAPPDRLPRQALAPAVRAAQDQVGGERQFTFTNTTQLRITREQITLVSP